MNLVSVYLYFVIIYLVIKKAKYIKTNFFVGLEILPFTETFFLAIIYI